VVSGRTTFEYQNRSKDGYIWYTQCSILCSTRLLFTDTDRRVSVQLIPVHSRCRRYHFIRSTPTLTLRNTCTPSFLPLNRIFQSSIDHDVSRPAVIEHQQSPHSPFHRVVIDHKQKESACQHDMTTPQNG
jgi:hypothetical protein